MKRNVDLIIVLIFSLCFSIATFTDSTDFANSTDSTEPITTNDDLSFYAQQGMEVQFFSEKENNIYIVNITDEEQLAKIQKEENKNNEGKLVGRTLTSILPKDEHETKVSLFWGIKRKLKNWATYWRVRN